jgi:hypothetical protein
MPRVRSKEKIMDPIPKKQVPEWKKLIADTIKVVNRSDKAQFDLILLAGQVETKYGENRVKRWADEAGIAFEAARQYRWLAHKGVNAAFIAKWARTDRKPNGLSYSVIRKIIGFTGSVKSPYTLEYLEWAVEHKATVVSITAYMNEVNAPHNSREEAAKEIKMALMDKQQHEGFNDYIRTALEQIVEENPETEDQVLATAITSLEDLNALKVAAGILTDEETALVGKAHAYVRKLKNYHNWLRDNKEQLIQSISYGHEVAPEMKHWLEQLVKITTELAETEIATFDSTTVEAPEVPLPSTKKKRKAA